MKIENKERIKRVLEIRRSNAATPVRNKKKYTRKTKHKKKTLKLFNDLISTSRFY